MHILRCEDKTSPQPPSKGEMRRKSDNALLTTMMIKHPPDAHTPLRQLADFLQRGRCGVKAIMLC